MLASIVRSPVKVIVGVLLVLLFGVIGMFRMPTQLTPEVQIPTITVESRWTGASPQEIERQIVLEQEEQLKNVEGVSKMTSECMHSIGRVLLEFPIGTDMSEALLRVNTRLQQVRKYPIDADPPVISTASSGDRPIAWFILKPRTPSTEDIEAFQAAHPQTAQALEGARKAQSAGLRLCRLRDAAEKHPEVASLLPPPDLDVSLYRKFAEDIIEARFERVDGVANSNVMGGREEEMQVQVNPQELAARGITIEEVRQALMGQNLDTTAGDVEDGKRSYVVRVQGQYRTPEDVGETVLKVVEGRPVYVRDVATVKLGYKEPDGVVRQFGTACIAINCQRAVGANVLDVMDRLRVANQELNEGVLEQSGLYLEQVYDETEYIYSAIGLVQSNIIVGGLLTVATLLIFLRSARSTFVIALAIPTSIIATFLVMSLMGRSLNVISLAGLAFAVGMLVDNAVVVLENIYQKAELGQKPFDAAVQGASEVGGAVLSSTLTTVAVFLPVLFIEEEAGQLFRDIALAISAGVALSLVVSLTFIPMASARLLGQVGKKTHARAAGAGPTNGQAENGHAENGHTAPVVRGAWAGGESASHGLGHRLLAPLRWLLWPLDLLGNAFVHTLAAFNLWLQRGVLRRLVTVVSFVGVSIGLSYMLMPRAEFLPNGNRNLVFGIMLPPPGYSIETLTDIGARIEDNLRPYWDVDPDSPEAAALEYPVIRDFFFVARDRQVFMGMKAADPMRAGELVPLVVKVASTEPSTFAIGSQSSLFEQGLTAGRTIDIEISGPDLRHLTALGGRVIGQVTQVVPGCQAFPKPSLDLSSPELHVDPRRVQAAEMGLDATQVGYATSAMVDGAYAGDYLRDGVKIDLTIIAQRSFTANTQGVSTVPIAVPTSSQPVPLASLATLTMQGGPEQINRRQRLRTITIQVKPPLEVPLEEAMERIQKEIVAPMEGDGSLKAGQYQINLAGTADKLRSTWSALQMNVYLALLITYLLMAALFESWLYPFVVILSVPLGAVGGFAALWLLNLFVLQPLDVLTMLGFVILIGTVVNNPILIVEQALILIRTEGMSHQEAVLESVRTRIRPIFMTTLTTILGLLPLVLFPGAGSELYRGLGAVVLGGLLISTLVTLVIVPSVFTLTMEMASLLGVKVKQEELEGDEQPPAAPPARPTPEHAPVSS